MRGPEGTVDAAAIERMILANLEGYALTAQRVRPRGPVRLMNLGGAVAVDGGAGSPRSRVVGLGLEGPADEADLGTIDEFFAETGSGYSVEVAPCTDAGLAPLLLARGFDEASPITVLTRPLGPGPVAAAEWSGGIIRRAGEDDAPALAAVFARGFGGYEAASEEDDLAARVTVAAPSRAVFVAERDGEPVACGAVEIHGTMALLFAGCTVPAARRLGAHRALLAARLAWAAERGCTLAVVQAAEGAPSLGNLRKAGFEPAYERRPFKRPPRPSRSLTEEIS